MGRKLMRVPRDFDHPLNTVWSGYLNPHYDLAEQCTPCEGKGSSQRGRELTDRWFGWDMPEDWVYVRHNYRYNRNAWQYNLDADDVAALLKADRLWEFTRVPDPRQPDVTRPGNRPLDTERQFPNGWLKQSNGYVPTPEEVNDYAIHHGMCHDSINSWAVIAAKLDREGVGRWCRCCDGEGIHWPSMHAKMAYETWESVDPPEGNGYQLWEDTSEGSPVSPVFRTLWVLAEWCASNATVPGGMRTTADHWMQMLSEDFVYGQTGNAVFI